MGKKDDVFVFWQRRNSQSQVKNIYKINLLKHSKVEKEKDDMLGKRTYELTISNHIVLVIYRLYLAYWMQKKDENGQKKIKGWMVWTG